MFQHRISRLVFLFCGLLCGFASVWAQSKSGEPNPRKIKEDLKRRAYRERLILRLAEIIFYLEESRGTATCPGG